jgi:hypothetical protein
MKIILTWIFKTTFVIVGGLQNIQTALPKLVNHLIILFHVNMEVFCARVCVCVFRNIHVHACYVGCNDDKLCIGRYSLTQHILTCDDKATCSDHFVLQIKHTIWVFPKQ